MKDGLPVNIKMNIKNSMDQEQYNLRTELNFKENLLMERKMDMEYIDGMMVHIMMEHL